MGSGRFCFHYIGDYTFTFEGNRQMTDVTVATAARRVRQPKTDLPLIEIEGQTWKARKDFAADIGVCDLTAKRLNLRTVYIGGVAYVPVAEGLCEIANRARRRNEAPREEPAAPVRRRRRW
jgi:hypothetical protein